jgi:hypothetical protein
VNGAPLRWVVYCIAAVTLVSGWMIVGAVCAVVRRRRSARTQVKN